MHNLVPKKKCAAQSLAMVPVGVLNLNGFLYFGCPGNLRPPYLRWHQRPRAEAELEHQEDVQGKMWAR